MDTKTLLVDASYLLKRSFHGAKSSYTKAGFMGGVYGFLTTVRKFVKDYNINKVILVWDGENGGIFRHRIDHMYKSNRKDKSWYTQIKMTEAEIQAEKEKDQSILIQRKKIQMYAEELFFRQMEVFENEADDLIAAYCIKNHKKEEIILYTNDKDFLQLLASLDISIYLQSENGIVEAGNFFQYFPYFYKNALTMKILCGDNSDEIAGINGIQEKTLIKYFPELIDTEMSVREICIKSVAINEERKANKKKPIVALENITKNVERLKINHRLMNLFDPFLTDEAKQAIEDQDAPLSDEGRGGDRLYKLMEKDDFLSLYSNYGNYASYVQPFYQIISREKDLLKKYNKNLLKS